MWVDDPPGLPVRVCFNFPGAALFVRCLYTTKCLPFCQCEARLHHPSPGDAESGLGVLLLMAEEAFAVLFLAPPLGAFEIFIRHDRWEGRGTEDESSVAGKSV